VKDTTTTIENDNTLSDDDDLMFDVVADTYYAFRVHLDLSVSTAGSNGLRAQMSGPASFTCEYWMNYMFAATFGALRYTQAAPIIMGTGTTTMHMTIEGWVKSTASGTVHLQIAQNTAEASPKFVKVFLGGWISAWKAAM